MRGEVTLRADPVAATDWGAALLACEIGRLQKVARASKVCSALVTVTDYQPNVIRLSHGYLRALRRAAGTATALIGVGEEGCAEAADVLGYGDAFTVGEIPTCVEVVTDELGHDRHASLRFLLDILNPGPIPDAPSNP